MKQENIKRNIHFLIYLNRSGSTLLAKKLSEYENISVGIEARFPDGLIRGKVDINSEQDLDHYLAKMYLDQKFRHWQINRGHLKERLRRYQYPVLFKHILSETLDLYFQNDDNQVIIHKDGRYFFHVDRIREQFPGARFIFVDRDPRAIFNSQKKSIDSITKAPMEKNIVKFAMSYKHTQRIIKNYSDEKFFCIVSYETLIHNEAAELARLLQFLNVDHKEKSSQKQYYDQIPESQKHLHTNLRGDKNIAERINAWQKELSHDEIYFLQCVLKNELKSKGYENIDITFKNVNDKIRFAKEIINYFIKYEAPFFLKMNFPRLYLFLSSMKNGFCNNAK